jgi:hypothetical protein
VEQFIGAFSSHGADWADQHDAYLGKAVAGAMDSVPSKGNQTHARSRTS